jgi:hypothetical protein
MASRGILISLAALVSACLTGTISDGAAPAGSYWLSAYNCSKMNCEPPFQSSKGAWSVATQDRAEMEAGIPFHLGVASGPTFYGKSIAAVQGDSITLSNHIQMANFEKWTRALKKPASETVGPAYVAGNITDTLTIAGGDGIAYFLPIYEVTGTFASSGEKFFDSRTFLCFGTTPRGGCGPKIWLTPGDGSNVHEFSQPKPGETLQFRFGERFQYFVDFYSRIFAPGAPVPGVLRGLIRDDEAVDFVIKLVGVSITDKDGKEIAGAKVVSDSGIEYKVLPPRPAQ